jgi:hypothetical protein
MYTYPQIIFCVFIAECLRRLVLMLKMAYTGPLSKIPGPWYGKFTSIPWMIENVTGNSMNVMPKLFEKWGDVVRVGRYF